MLSALVQRKKVCKWLWHMTREVQAIKELLRCMNSIWKWSFQSSLECLRWLIFRELMYRACPDSFDPENNARSKVQMYNLQTHRNPATLWAEGINCLIFCYGFFIYSRSSSAFLCKRQIRKVVEENIVNRTFNLMKLSNRKLLGKVSLSYSDFAHMTVTTAHKHCKCANSSKMPLISAKLNLQKWVHFSKIVVVSE